VGNEPQQQQQQALAQSSVIVHAEEPSTSGDVGSNAAAAQFAQLVQQHHRFELVQQQQQQPSKHDSSRAAGLVQFTALGSPLHGVVADEVRRHRQHSTQDGLLSLRVKHIAHLAVVEIQLLLWVPCLLCWVSCTFTMHTEAVMHAGCAQSLQASSHPAMQLKE
jgi:hypothetical protein